MGKMKKQIKKKQSVDIAECRTASLPDDCAADYVADIQLYES